MYTSNSLHLEHVTSPHTDGSKHVWWLSWCCPKWVASSTCPMGQTDTRLMLIHFLLCSYR